MKRFTDAELERANSVDLLAYIQSRGYAVKRTGSQYCLEEHDSLVIRDNKWYWFSQRMGGKTIDFLVKYEKIPFVEAVKNLLGETVQTKYGTRSPSHTAKEKPQDKREFCLPTRSPANDTAIAYLKSRGIDETILQYCIANGTIYQTNDFNRAQVVFVGCDLHNQPRYAFSREIHGNGKHEAVGSNKAYNFALPMQDPNCSCLWVFEGAIDALSHATLCKQKGGYRPTHRLALGGVATTALSQYLKDHPNIAELYLGLDNDERGQCAAKAIQDAYSDMLAVHNLPPPHCKDYFSGRPVLTPSSGNSVPNASAAGRASIAFGYPKATSKGIP